MGFLAWGFSPEKVPIKDYGEAISSTPVPLNKSNGQLEAQLTTPAPMPVSPSMQRAYVAYSPPGGPYWIGYRNAGRMPVGQATTQYIEAPARPITKAAAQAIQQYLSGQVAHGSAPTSGIYTGVEDLL